MIRAPRPDSKHAPMDQQPVKQLTIRRPDDWHAHLRDKSFLAATCRDMARYFGRVIVMPNLNPPIRTVAEAGDYRERILEAMRGLEAGPRIALPRRFEPLMTLYLSEATRPADIAAAAQSSVVHAAKLYPAGVTTHSEAGVRDVAALYPVLDAMEKHGLPLLVHGEVADPAVDIFDREKVFIERHLDAIARKFPGLKIVLEHITTREAADFVREAPAHVAATITAHHLLYNRNHLLAGGIRPHYYCLPVLKRDTHQRALIEAAVSGNPKFFLGTDSAPHAQGEKESACGCAGCYTAHAAIELYAEAFEAAGAIDKLEAFASHFGADFYGLPRNRGTITLAREEWRAPESIPFGDAALIPLRAGEAIRWAVTGQNDAEQNDGGRSAE